MHFTQRISFGPRDAVEVGTDVDSCVAQLAAAGQRVGIRSLADGPVKVAQWPESLTFSLETRIDKAQRFRQRRESVDRDASLNTKQKRVKKRRIGQEESIWLYDQIGLAHQAIYGDDPVRQRFMQFWWNHFTIGSTNGTRFYTGHLYWDVIGGGISGSFADLAYRATKHPAMLTYLDNIYSVGENSPKAQNARRNNSKIQIGLNDNLARELMELHTISPAAGYTEADIREAAKILSGWGIIFNKPIKGKGNWNGTTDYENIYVPSHAEPGNKTVLGERFSSGKGALRKLVNFLSERPETRTFICRKLCLHFVSDTPSADDLRHVEQAWQATKGDLPAVHRAVIERAFVAQTPKMQWPLTWLFTVLRTSGADLIGGWDDLYRERQVSAGEARVRQLYREIGQDFWSRRQPNGFSLEAVDWISTEHFDRRLRLAFMIGSKIQNRRPVNEMMDHLAVDEATRRLVETARDDKDAFIILTCSPAFMGL